MKLISAQIQLDWFAHYKIKPSEYFALDVDVSLPHKGITVIFGESGSGKTSFLRCLAGLEKTAKGTITVDDQVWQDQLHFLPTYKRGLGYVFQEASLFDHLSTKQNLEYGIKRLRDKSQDSDFLNIIKVLDIQKLLDKPVGQLSGGERQRVAIGRALLVKPQLLLMDEPLASLDNARKKEILPYLESLAETFDIPIVYVTHSIEEVVRLADYVVVLNQGRIVAKGSVNELFSRVDLPFGSVEETGVVLDCKMIQAEPKWNLAHVEFNGGRLYLPDNQYSVGSTVRIRILASDISISLNEPSDLSMLNVLKGKIVSISDTQHPAMQFVSLLVGDSQIIASVTKKSVQQLNLKINDHIWALIKSVAIIR